MERSCRMPGRKPAASIWLIETHQVLMKSAIRTPPCIGKHLSWCRHASITMTAEYSPAPYWWWRVKYTDLAERHCPMRSFGISRLPNTEGDKRDVKIWLARPSWDHHSAKDCILARVDLWWMTGGYVGQSPGSKTAPERGSSAIWLSKFALSSQLEGFVL